MTDWAILSERYEFAKPRAAWSNNQPSRIRAHFSSK